MVLAALAAATEPDFGAGLLARLTSALRRDQAEDPVAATAKTVLAASLLFYRAEKGQNAGVASFQDALGFMTAHYAGSYSSVSAQSELGKALGSAITLLGASMRQPPAAQP